MNGAPRRTIVHALHGFLGAPEDFAPLAGDLRAGFAAIDPCAPPLPFAGDDRRLSIVGWSVEGFLRAGMNGGWAEWPAAFAAAFAARFGDVGARHVLLGYSLGGRLAMHLLGCTTDAALGACLPAWDAAVFVSAHPGSGDAGERRQRLESDAEWARRLRTEPWSQIVQAWNAQPVLASSSSLPPSRSSAMVDPGAARRRLLADLLNAFSLGGQDDLGEKLARLGDRFPRPPRILLVAGARDRKYVYLMRELQSRLAWAGYWQSETAGHRVPWDDPVGFAARMTEFLGRDG